MSTAPVDLPRPTFWRYVRMRIAITVWALRGLALSWVRRQLGIEADMNLIGSHLQMKDLIIDGIRADYNALLDQHQLLVRRIKYYGEHNDSLKHTKKKFDQILLEEAAEAATKS